MAKSLRSKRSRKMRNIKRERYGKKELIKLKKMLGLPTDDTPAADSDMTADATTESENVISDKDRRRIHSIVREGSDRDDSDAEKEIEEVILLTTSRKLRQSYRFKKEKEAQIQEALEKKEKEENGTEDKEAVAIKPTTEEMEHDQKRVYNGGTLRDQYGNYPVWMNQKKMRMLAKVNRKTKRKTKRLERAEKIKSVKDNIRRKENAIVNAKNAAAREAQDVSIETMEVEVK